MERSYLGSEGNISSEFLWPQRYYTCSFCKRQFNSAQALGGHMNVHRRDRAMLIQLPSWVFDQCPPNPNSKPLPNPKLPYQYTHHHLLSSPPTSFSSSSYTKNINSTQLESSTSFCEDLSKKNKSLTRAVGHEVGEFGKGFSELELLKKSERISLDLEIGCKDPKDVLDLELRLGCF